VNNIISKLAKNLETAPVTNRSNSTKKSTSGLVQYVPS
jgi:hypothetical protein